jgi:dTDP-glucose 4,6-dehydratase
MRSPHQILVTGGLGFIGSAFIRWLLATPTFKGQIINIDKMTHGSNSANLSGFENDPRYHFYKLDICDFEALSKICDQHPIDTLVHFAADSHVDRSIYGPRDFVHNNIQGTFELLEIIRKRPHIHFHHISTDEVYGSLGDKGFFNEHSSYQPNSPYSATKAASDHLVKAWAHTYGLSITMSHCSNNYGPYQNPEKLIPHMIQCALLGKNLPVYGNGHNVRDWIHVEDHVRGIWLIIQQAASGSCYNLGSRQTKTNLELVEEIARQIAAYKNEPAETYLKRIEFVKDRKGHDYRYAIDPSKAEQELGFSARYDLVSGLKTTIDWYLHHESWLLGHKPLGIQTQKA